jgi:predicted TIM-barrel fold metal-dependent hydrolase
MPGTIDVSTIPVIDADTHVTEPADLWTSRLPKKWADEGPRVGTHPQTKHNHWHIGDTWLNAVAYYSQAGWKDYPPVSPFEYEETDPAAHDSHKRLERMDEYGINSQVLYPNIIGFNSALFMAMDHDVSIACTRAYNDFITDWASADPNRLIPISMVPFWDLEAAVAEMTRCADLGHRGVLFANKYEQVGLPSFIDEYWDPIYAAAADLDLAVNYHIGFADPDRAFFFSEKALELRKDAANWRVPKTVSSVVTMMSQLEVIAKLVTSGVCDRFPTVKFVSVESGFGYVPFLLECLDWHWRGNGVDHVRPFLPSEVFARQCYGTFWFEKSTLPLLDLYPDNFMFSTDFPHPTSVSPGPISPADIPSEHVVKAFQDLPADIAKKALHDNAHKVYRL